jgi:hypothetical protein
MKNASEGGRWWSAFQTSGEFAALATADLPETWKYDRSSERQKRQ